MKPTSEQIKIAVGKLAALAMFPADPIARSAIMNALSRFVNTTQELNWLGRTMIDKVGVWHGTAELRGVFCSKFKPADGEESVCALTPGFTADDNENRYVESESDETAKRITEWKKQTKALPASEEWENKQLTEQITERLAIKAGQPLPKAKPIPVGPTPIRTEEQRQAELRKLEEQLSARQTSRPN